MPNPETKQLLFELESELIRQDAPILHKLCQGKTAEKLQDIFGTMGIPKNIQELYQWKNGTITDDAPLGQCWLFPLGSLMSAEKSFRYYQNFVNSDEYWIDGMFPVFESLGGDFYLIDINATSPTKGFVFFYSRSAVDFETIISKYDSLETLLRTIVECFKSGVYFYNQLSGYLEFQFQLEREINIKNNPKSAYWTLFK